MGMDDQLVEQGRIWSVAQRLLRGVVDGIAPPKCILCRTDVTEPAALCFGCWRKLHLIDEPVCNVLGTPFTYWEGDNAVSAAALAVPPVWDRARAAVAFDDASKEVVHALKYADRQEAGLFMAAQMVRAGRVLLAEADIILPVPLHRFRLWRRRFNQAAFLARELAKLSGKPWSATALVRTRYSRSQVGLSAEQRHKNVAKSFEVAAGDIATVAGRKVLLIDDVMTTGATATACTQVLKRAGAQTVDVLTFALVLDPKRPHIAA